MFNRRNNLGSLGELAGILDLDDYCHDSLHCNEGTRSEIALASSSLVRLEQIRLCSSRSGLFEVAQANAYEPIALLRPQRHSVSQRQSDVRQFFAGRGRSTWRMAAGKDLELACL